MEETVMPTNARTVWSVNPFATERRIQRGRNVTQVTADLGEDTPTYRAGSSIPSANLSMVKHRAAKHPFSRYSAPQFDPALATSNPR